MSKKCTFLNIQRMTNTEISKLHERRGRKISQTKKIKFATLLEFKYKFWFEFSIDSPSIGLQFFVFEKNGTPQPSLLGIGPT